MKKEDLVTGKEYRIRKQVQSEGMTKKYIWVPAVLEELSNHFAVFNTGKYRITFKYCQLRDEVRE